MTVLPMAVLWAVAEVVCYLLVCWQVLRPDMDLIGHNIYDATDRPYVQFDPVTGYRYIPGATRLVITNQQQLTVDHIVRVNAQGYCSVRDFSAQRTDDSKRYIVFGDSYTAGEVSDTTWPDLANTLLQLQLADTPHVFMNFALEAVGLATWHRQYFQEVVPGYDFDGIVLAVHGGDGHGDCDLNREAVVKHSSPLETRIGFFHELPTDASSLSKAWARMLHTSSVYDMNRLEHFLDRALGRPVQYRFHWAPPRPYFGIAVTSATCRLVNFVRLKKDFFHKEPVLETPWPSDSTALCTAYMGPERMAMLTDILDHCRAHGKDVIIAAIPSFQQLGLEPHQRNDDACHPVLRYMARAHGAFYIDGSAAFDTVPTHTLSRYTLKGDAHWNRQGAELFARHFAKAISNRRSPQAGSSTQVLH